MFLHRLAFDGKQPSCEIYLKICFETLQNSKHLKGDAEWHPHDQVVKCRKEILRWIHWVETRSLWNHSALPWGRPGAEMWPLILAPSFIFLTHRLPLTILLLIPGSPKTQLEMGSHFLLQGIFPTQVLNPGLLHCRQVLNCLSHKGSPLAIIAFS